MRERNDGLDRLFGFFEPHLIERHSEEDGARHLEGDAPQAEYHRILYGSEKQRVLEHFDEVLKADPRASQNPSLEAEILECQHDARHGRITEYEIPRQHRQQHKIQPLVVSDLHQGLCVFFRPHLPKRPLSHVVACIRYTAHPQVPQDFFLLILYQNIPVLKMSFLCDFSMHFKNFSIFAKHI